VSSESVSSSDEDVDASSSSSSSSEPDRPARPPSFPTTKSEHNFFLGQYNVHTLAIPAPMCTIGPSGPMANALPTPHAVPAIFALNVLPLNNPGIFAPFNVAITCVTPPPLANGA
jgi:hypothetical protein